MPQIEKKIPANLLNTDVSPDVLHQAAAVNLRNVRYSKSIDGKSFRFENIMKNMRMTGQDGKIPAGSERIAHYEDPAGEYVIWFTHKPGSPGDDQINFYDLKNERFWLVAKASRGDDGEIEGGLGFQIGKFYDLVVANGTLFWTSDHHEPRKIHIGAGIKACQPTEENTPMYDGWQYNWINSGDDDTSVKNLSLAIKPPAYPPMIQKRADPTISRNNLAGESFKFATQYYYYSKEESSLSLFSEGSMINSDADKDKNVIDVTINPLEFPIPQGVKLLRLYVKVESTQAVHLVHSWTREEMESGGLLTYKFYGNYYGPKLNSITANEPFHSVPEKALVVEIIKNRLMLGNCTEGKDTPKKTSMTLTLGEATDIADISNAVKKVYRVMYRGKRVNGLSRPRFYYSGLYVKLDEVSEPGYYLIPGTEIRMGAGFTGIPAVFAPVPANVELTNLQFKGKTLDQIIEATRSVTIASLYESYIIESANTIEVIGLTPLGNIQATGVFLHDADYTGGIEFFDRYLRRCGGAVTHPDIKVTIPPRTFDADSGYTAIRWKLDNADAINEIPADAVYYAPLLTRNSRALRFIEGFSGKTRYATVDPDGTYKYDDGKKDDEPGNDDTPYLVFSVATAAIAIDRTSLLNVGLGYSFTQGDMCILVRDDNALFNIPVIGEDGNYILLAAKDIGNLENRKFIFHIYTPYKVDTNDTYNEVGQLYPVSQAGTEGRKYSALEGVFLPDVYVIQRKNDLEPSYLAYAMSPNDLYWQKWFNHFGRATVKTDLGQRVKTGNVSFSDVFIPGTAVNGLSAFHALNEENLAPELGPIRRLVSTNKIQGEGNVLLAICEAGVASLYIGESEIMDQAGNSILVKSDKVIGQINTLKVDAGTIHPESAKRIDGLVFWYSHSKREFVQYSINGIDSISKYGFMNATYKLSQLIDKHKSEGKLVMVNGGVDPYFKEYLVQLAVKEPEAATLCSMPSIITIEHTPADDNPNLVTATFKLPEGQNRWKWEVLDADGYSVASGTGYSEDGNVSQEIDMLSTGVAYTLVIRTDCGGGNLSAERKAFMYIEGVEEPPTAGDGCVGLSFVDTFDRFPDAIAGELYLAYIRLDGSVPITMNILQKPAWMGAVFISDRVIEFSGDPTLGDIANDQEVHIEFTNCAGDILAFSKLINVVTL